MCMLHDVLYQVYSCKVEVLKVNTGLGLQRGSPPSSRQLISKVFNWKSSPTFILRILRSHSEHDLRTVRILELFFSPLFFPLLYV